MFPFFVVTAIAFIMGLMMLDGYVRASPVPVRGLRGAARLAPKTALTTAVLGAAVLAELTYCTFW